jgi:hypothetical protein
MFGTKQHMEKRGHMRFQAGDRLLRQHCRCLAGIQAQQARISLDQRQILGQFRQRADSGERTLG